MFGRCVTILFGLLPDDSRFLLKAFRREESISKKYLSKKFSTFFFFGDLNVNFVVTVFDPNTDFYGLLDIDSVVTDFDPNTSELGRSSG